MTTVLITGASGGIGRATAETFAKAGWDILLVSREESSLESLANDLRTENVQVFYKAIDFSQPKLISPGIKELLDNGLQPSVLINNAGVAWTGELISMPIESWKWLIQINLTSVFQICSSVVPKMRKNGGLIINVSSHAARNAFPQWGAYCVSKAALESFTKCLAEEERPNSIRACTITLGAVNTTLWDKETVQGDFDRKSMLTSDQVAFHLLNLAKQSSNQLIEDITVMPASGAF